MAQIINLAPTTELEAINTMLATIGIAPVEQTAVDTPPSSDLDMAVSELRNAAREVLSIGWKFNSRRGVEVAPAGQYTWVASDSSSTVLNVFKKPSGTLAWAQTRCSQMTGADLVEGLSTRYQEAAAYLLVLVDTLRNRDGLEAASFPYVYLDTVQAVNFENMPEEARRYITVLAARRFAAKNAGAKPLVDLAQEDEAMAFRILTRAHGIRERRSMFATADAQEIFGQRPNLFGGFGRQVFRQ